MRNLEGKTAMITGASRGIGKGIAELYAKNGCKIAILDIDDEEGMKTVQELKQHTDVEYYHCDVSSVAECQAVFEKAAERFGGIDILVNNAGIPVRDRIEDITEEIWERFISINMKSAFFLSQIFAEHVKDRKTGYGRIINMSSVRTKIFDVTHAGYSITKTAVNAITRCFAVSYGGYGITANAIAPGFVLTPMTEHYMSDPRAKEMIKMISPIERGNDIEEIANVALFMALPDSGAVNGQIVFMDGGGVSGPGAFA